MSNIKNTFSKFTVVTVFQILGIIAIFDWIVFPGLTAKDTISNIFALIILIFTIIFIWYSLGLNKIFSKIWKDEE